MLQYSDTSRFNIYHNLKNLMNLNLPFDAGLQVVAEADLGLVEPVN